MDVGRLDVWIRYGLGMVRPFPDAVTFWALVIAGIVYLVKTIAGGRMSTSTKEETAIDILKKRYARGEIDAEEFARRKKDLES